MSELTTLKPLSPVAKPTKSDARRVLQVVDFGLVSGLGVAQPGKFCVEAAICYALGYEHGDQPKCVANCIRSYKIAINDAKWSSNAARTTGMRRAAIAQLGSDFLDLPENRDQRTAFVSYLAKQVIRQIVPISLRLVAEKYKRQIGAENATRLIEAALKCEKEGTEASAREAYAAANAAYAAAYAAANAAASNDAYAAAYAANAAASNASNAANAAANDAYAAAYAANAAASNAADAAYAAYAAASNDAYAAAYAANDANAAANAASNDAYAAAYAANDANAAANAASNDAYAAAYAANAAANDAYAAAYAAKQRDEILNIAAEICVQACIKFKTPGSRWLDLAA
jgi:hypothetical protein